MTGAKSGIFGLFQGKRMRDMVIVLTNAPDEATALALAEQLIASRVAACVNCMSPVQSAYYWQGKVERTQEIPLLIKAPRANYRDVERVIREHHPYEVPEIIALPIVAGLPAYLQWIADETISAQ